MNLLILKTDIQTKKKVKSIKSVLNDHHGISSWSIDLEDIDKVLRIEKAINSQDDEIMRLIREQGFVCEELE